MTTAAVWCEECEAYECPYCDDKASDFPFVIDYHILTCPERPKPATDSGVSA